MQDIKFGPRLNDPGAAGLVQFRYAGERVAFTLPSYEQLASDLAEAAKRSLEDPVTRKRKAHEDDD
ncbi:MAG: hypothetical protein AAF125_27680 [Chloroflexota bacterium]